MSTDLKIIQRDGTEATVSDINAAIQQARDALSFHKASKEAKESGKGGIYYREAHLDWEHALEALEKLKSQEDQKVLANFNFYIDRQFGIPIRLLIENGKVSDGRDWDYKGKFIAKIIGKTPQQVKEWLKEQFPGTYYALKPR